MNVLVVAGRYYPKADANTVCTECIIDALKQSGHSVCVISPKREQTDKENEVQHGNRVFRFCSDLSRYYFYQDACTNLILPLSMNRIHRLTYGFSRALNKLKYKMKRIDFERLAVNLELEAIAAGICQVCDTESIDLILSVSLPFTSHLAVLQAMNRMNHRPKWMVYMLDPHGGSDWVTLMYDKTQLQQEENAIFDACNSIVMLDVLKSDYACEAYNKYADKIFYLKPTLFNLSNQNTYYEEGIEKIHDSVSVLYAGTLYDTCRSNDAVFLHLKNMALTEACCVHIMGKAYPKCLSELQKISRECPDKFKLYGRKPYAFAKGSMQKADILVNIGNDYTDIIPSKIFEYMATRKPILHFYRIDNDTALPYLRKYPLALCIDERDGIEENGELIHKFLKRVKDGMSISAEELAGIFKDDLTPHVQQEFIKIVNYVVNMNDVEQ